MNRLEINKWLTDYCIASIGASEASDDDIQNAVDELSGFVIDELAPLLHTEITVEILEQLTAFGATPPRPKLYLVKG